MVGYMVNNYITVINIDGVLPKEFEVNTYDNVFVILFWHIGKFL